MSQISDNANDKRDLEVLRIIEESPDVNQRGLAQQTSMALGLVNSCLKRLARKGLIKIQEAPGRRYLYYLTPHGMAEKTRLTYEYVRLSVHFYAEARKRCRALFQELSSQDICKVAFLGQSDLTEIAYLTLQEFPIECVVLYVEKPDGEKFFQIPLRSLSQLEKEGDDFDLLLYTDTRPPQEVPAYGKCTFREIF